MKYSRSAPSSVSTTYCLGCPGCAHWGGAAGPPCGFLVFSGNRSPTSSSSTLALSLLLYLALSQSSTFLLVLCSPSSIQSCPMLVSSVDSILSSRGLPLPAALLRCLILPADLTTSVLWTSPPIRPALKYLVKGYARLFLCSISSNFTVVSAASPSASQQCQQQQYQYEVFLLQNDTWPQYRQLCGSS